MTYSSNFLSVCKLVSQIKRVHTNRSFPSYLKINLPNRLKRCSIPIRAMAQTRKSHHRANFDAPLPTHGRHDEKAGATRFCGFQSGDDDKPPALIYEGCAGASRGGENLARIVAGERTWATRSRQSGGQATRQQRYTPFGGNVVDKGR